MKRAGFSEWTPVDISPGDHYSMGVQRIRAIKAADKLAVKEGNLHIYLHGKVYYRDAFGRRRYAQFCFLVQSVGVGQLAIDATTNDNRSN